MRNSDAGSHSSEEELEEINVRQGLPCLGGGVELPCLGTEKRKWSELSTTEPSSESDFDCGEFTSSDIRTLRLCSLNEDSVSQTFSMEEQNQKKFESPVEFSNSPPPNAHRPRRSEFPQSKLIGFSNQQKQDVHLLLTNLQHTTSNNQLTQNQQQLAGHNEQLITNNQLFTNKIDESQSLLDFPEIRTAGIDISKGREPATSAMETDVSTSNRRIFSPRKRSRKSQQLLSRPCLDFEKMQQMQTVSWHGGELSLFCW